MDYEVLEEIEAMSLEELPAYIKKRAEKIVRNTQGDSWDDPEWEMDAVELAHALYRMARDNSKKP